MKMHSLPLGDIVGEYGRLNLGRKYLPIFSRFCLPYSGVCLNRASQRILFCTKYIRRDCKVENLEVPDSQG